MTNAEADAQLMTCLNCRYLELDPSTDTWYCDNLDAMDIPDDLEEDLMEDYADRCGCFEQKPDDT